MKSLCRNEFEFHSRKLQIQNDDDIFRVKLLKAKMGRFILTAEELQFLIEHGVNIL